jgi:hypothetical protein
MLQWLIRPFKTFLHVYETAWHYVKTTYRHYSLKSHQMSPYRNWYPNVRINVLQLPESGVIPTSNLIKNAVYPTWCLSYFLETFQSDAGQCAKIFHDRFLEHCLNILSKRLNTLKYIIYLVEKLG